ncbi:MAG: response regulator [Thermoanaerobaculia bacterium]
MQPLKHSPQLEIFTTRRVVVVEGDRQAAEMLHTFFRLMELDCSLIRPDADVIATLRRERPDILILDLDLPDLRALELASAARHNAPALPIIFLTEHEPELLPVEGPVMRKPRDRFEELLRLFELVLAME